MKIKSTTIERRQMVSGRLQASQIAEGNTTWRLTRPGSKRKSTLRHPISNRETETASDQGNARRNQRKKGKKQTQRTAINGNRFSKIGNEPTFSVSVQWVHRARRRWKRVKLRKRRSCWTVGDVRVSDLRLRDCVRCVHVDVSIDC